MLSERGMLLTQLVATNMRHQFEVVSCVRSRFMRMKTSIQMLAALDRVRGSLALLPRYVREDSRDRRLWLGERPKSRPSRRARQRRMERAMGIEPTVLARPML
jgi:hypothetical protein